MGFSQCGRVSMQAMRRPVDGADFLDFRPFLRAHGHPVRPGGVEG